MKILRLCLFICLTEIVNGGVNPTQYLFKYGYLRSSRPSRWSLDRAIRIFQNMVGLNVNGWIDSATYNAMNEPRCGMKDMDINSRRKRAVATPRKWDKLTVYYHINSIVPVGLRSSIRRSFKVWEKYMPLSCVETTSESFADIRIGFYEGDHSDGTPFDGVGGAVAHAFFPPNGDMHFDLEEPWTTNPYVPNGLDIFQTSLHEAGHSMGLSHSTVPEAIMAPIYKRNTFIAGLHDDDIARISSLYQDGTNNRPTTIPPTTNRRTNAATSRRPTTRAPTTQRATTVRTTVSSCTISWIDAAASIGDNRVYYFQGNKYYIWDSSTSTISEYGYISSGWRRGPVNDLTAAFLAIHDYTKHIYLLKGNNIWMYTTNRGYVWGPEPVNTFFKGVYGTVLDVLQLQAYGNKFYVFTTVGYFRIGKIPPDATEVEVDYLNSGIYPRSLAHWGLRRPFDEVVSMGSSTEPEFYFGDSYAPYYLGRLRLKHPPRGLAEKFCQ